MKKIEINRIYKCFIEEDYENIYQTNTIQLKKITSQV